MCIDDGLQIPIAGESPQIPHDGRALEELLFPPSSLQAALEYVYNQPAKGLQQRAMQRGSSMSSGSGISSILPQVCAVCHEQASGMYFGAMVCLPCKSFFIRCTKEGEPKFSCVEGGLCDISGANRLRCQYCRYQKCLCVGMCRKEKPESVEPGEGQELCKVCSDIANGIHFGVHTCEGCKKFFRRALKEYSAYFCKMEGSCSLNPRNRNACRYCRYQKCITVGMSRTAIRMGRPKKRGGGHGVIDKPYLPPALIRAGKLKYLKMENKSNDQCGVIKSTFEILAQQSDYRATPITRETYGNMDTDSFQHDVPKHRFHSVIVENPMKGTPEVIMHSEELYDAHQPQLTGSTRTRMGNEARDEDYDSSPSDSSQSRPRSCDSSSDDTVVDIEQDLDTILCSLSQYNDVAQRSPALNSQYTSFVVSNTSNMYHLPSHPHLASNMPTSNSNVSQFSHLKSVSETYDQYVNFGYILAPCEDITYVNSTPLTNLSDESQLQCAEEHRSDHSPVTVDQLSPVSDCENLYIPVQNKSQNTSPLKYTEVLPNHIEHISYDASIIKTGDTQNLGSERTKSVITGPTLHSQMYSSIMTAYNI